MGEARRRSLLGEARPIPKLHDFIGKTRADGFDDYVSEMLHAEAWAATAGTGEQRMMVRMLRTMGVAVVEALRLEHAAGSSEIDAILMMSRVLGHTAMTATASVLVEDAPFSSIATVLIEEFRFGSRQAADQLERQQQVER